MANSKDFLLNASILTQIAKSFEVPISKILGEKIKKNVTVIHQNILYHVVSEPLEYVGAQYVNISGEFKSKVKGAFYFLLPSGEALNISGTFLNKPPEELLGFINAGFNSTAEGIIKDIFLRLISEFSSVLIPRFNEVKSELSNVKEINILENLKEFEENIEGDEFVFLTYELTLEGEESFIAYLVLSKELAFSIAPMDNAEGMSVNSTESKSLDSVSKEELAGNVEMLRRIKVPIIVSLAQKKMTVEEIIKQLSVGSIIEFNVAFDSYLDLQIGDKKIGEGEVVTINDFYGLQIKSILSARETLETLL